MNTVNIGYIYLFWDKYTQPNVDRMKQIKRHQNREYKLRHLTSKQRFNNIDF